MRRGTVAQWSSSPSSSASHSPTSSWFRNAHLEPGAQSGEPSMVIVPSHRNALHCWMLICSTFQMCCGLLSWHRYSVAQVLRGWVEVLHFRWIYLLTCEWTRKRYKFFFCSVRIIALLDISPSPGDAFPYIFPFNISSLDRVAFPESNQNNESEYHKISIAF